MIARVRPLLLPRVSRQCVRNVHVDRAIHIPRVAPPHVRCAGNLMRRKMKIEAAETDIPITNNSITRSQTTKTQHGRSRTICGPVQK